jgi:translation initiation factor IF-2
MAEARTMRLNKVLREFNISLDRAVEFLKEHGHEIDARPTTKISGEVYDVLFDEFQTDKSKKRESKEVGEEKRKEKERLRLEREKEQEEKERKAEVVRGKASLDGPKQVGKIDLNKKPEAKEETPEPVKEPVKETPKEEAKPEPKKEVEVVRAGAKLSGTKQVGKIDLDAPKKPVAKKEAPKKVEPKKEEPKKETPKVVAKEAPKKEEAPKQEAVKEETKDAPEASKDDNRVTTNYKKLDGPNFTGEKIFLNLKNLLKRRTIRKPQITRLKSVVVV